MNHASERRYQVIRKREQYISSLKDILERCIWNTQKELGWKPRLNAPISHGESTTYHRFEADIRGSGI